MPRYSYNCRGCDTTFDIFHSLRENYTLCVNCGEDGLLDRLPNTIFVSREKLNTSGTEKVGEVVENAISEAREELQQDKDALKSRVYEK